MGTNWSMYKAERDTYKFHSVQLSNLIKAHSGAWTKLKGKTFNWLL